MSCLVEATSPFSMCCGHPSENNPPHWFSVVEQITAVALAVFSFQVSSDLFVPFFLVGLVIGGYQALTSDASERDHGAHMGCSRGLMEQLTGIKLPRLVSLATDVAVMYCHIDHHASVFVPMVAVYTGAKLALSSTDLSKKILTVYER